MAGSLGHLAATVSLNIDPFKQSSSALMSTIRNTNQALKLQDNYVKAYGNGLNSMKTHYSTLEQQMSNYNAKLKQQEANYKELSSQTAKTAEEQEKLTSRQQNAASQLNRTKSAMNSLDGQMQALNRQILLQESGWQKASDKLGKFGNVATSAGQKMSSMGSTMTTRVTAPIVAGFGYAAKSAIDFNSQIANIGPLLQANGESASQVKREMNEMADSSKKWSMQYGVSTNNINSGLEELVKRGYSAKQALGAMPSILNATKASGDDFNSVMKVSTSTLEQFGLKSNTTSGMLKNTQRVTDSLTYTANATAAGFTDMGDAMTYVGPTAHAAGLSLEETASAIGLMSNQGIEGSVAGTALRSALTRLMKPSKQNAAGFKELGINVADFKNHSLTLPEILNKIKTNTAGWTKEQRAAAIATAFGTEAQAGMNALVSEGGDALTDLTNKTEKANGSTKKIADTMNNTQAAKIAKFKESLHVLAITVGDDLLPTLTPLIKQATGVVKSFTSMDKSSQQTIIKMLALGAAMGPVLSLTGKLTSGIGGTANVLSTVTGGIARWKVAGEAGVSTGGRLASMFSKSAFEAKNLAGTATATAGATGEMAGGLTGLLTSLTPIAPALLVTAGVVAGGAAVWELWGKKAWESQQRTEKWGTDVGAAADKSLSKMQNFNAQASTALGSFGDNALVSGDKAAKAFKGMGNQIQSDAKKANGEISKEFNSLPPKVQSVVQKSVEESKKGNTEIASQSKQLSTNVSNILKSHNGNVKKLTDEQRTYVENSQQQLNENEVKLLGISGKKKVAVMKALNGNVRNLTESQAKATLETIQKSALEEEKVYEKNAKSLKDMRSKGMISEKAYNIARDKLSSDHKKKVNTNLEAIANIESKYSTTHSLQLEDLVNKEHLTWTKIDKQLSDSQKNHKEKLSSIAKEYGDVSNQAQEAGKHWNSLVLDPKTGKIKTNAQQVINDSINTKDGWRKLYFDLKHAKIDSNAKSMIGVAAIQSGKWDQLTFKEQKATIKSNAGKAIAESLKASGEWDKMSLEEKEAIVTSNGGADLAKLIYQSGQWNSLTFKNQKALVEDKATKPVMNALDKLNIWNKLNVQQQEAIVTAKGKSEVNDLLVQFGVWNSLTFDQKMLQVKDYATQPIMQMLDKAGIWNNLTMQQQEAIVNAKGLPEIEQLLQQFGIWNNLSFKEQEMFVQDKATKTIMNVMNKYGLWKNMPDEEKNAIINSKGGPELVDTILKYQNWNDLPDSIKNAIVKSQGKADMADMVIKYGLWNDMPDKEKRLLANDVDARAKLNNAGIAVDIYNNKPINIKELEGNNVGVLDRLKTGEQAIINYNGKQVIVKKLKGDNAQVVGQVDGANIKVDGYNGKKIPTKSLKGNNADVNTKTDSAGRSLDRYRNNNPGSKNLKGNDATTPSARTAITAIQNWNRQNPVTHFFKTIVQKIAGKAKGTTDFEGGPVMVNDQRGSMFREMIHLPTGENFVPTGRNVIMALPKHAQVIPAGKTNRLLGGIPQYANGTPGYSRVIKQFTDLSPNLLRAGDTVTTNNSRGDNITNAQQFHINVTVNTSSENGNDIDRLVSSEIERQLREQFNNESVAFGGGSIA